MSLSTNPLKQYFRRPAVYLKLPSQGKYYAPGVVDVPPTGELPVYPMTAIDEITSKTPDALFNGTAISELIKSCIPDIKDPWAINSVDLDSILIAIRAAASGSTLEIESACPKCENQATFGVDLIGVLGSLSVGDYSQELEIGNLAVKFRPLTFREMNEASLGQFEVQKIFAALEKEENMEVKAKHSQQALKDITDLTIKILTSTIEYIKTPTVTVTEKEFILDFLNNCDKDTYVIIRDTNAKLRAAAELKPLDIKCTNCGNEYKQPFTLNPTDFFG
jgi:hypothetical protein